jgi:hypothetical protein
MSIEDTKAKIAVMQAFARGAKIECETRGGFVDSHECQLSASDEAKQIGGTYAKFVKVLE